MTKSKEVSTEQGARKVSKEQLHECEEWSVESGVVKEGTACLGLYSFADLKVDF